MRIFKLLKKSLLIKIPCIIVARSLQMDIMNCNGWILKGRPNKKYLLEVQDQEIFAFAGIYSSWKNPTTNELINSYSILTTAANE